MSVLLRRSILVLVLLFGLLFAVGTGVMYHYQLPMSYAIILAVVVVGLQFLLGPFLLDWIFKIRWAAPEEVSPAFAEFLRELCDKRRIPTPRFGIIDDGNPNAFTYGHVPGDSRLVVTSGILQMLDEDEIEAVVAHEVGHIKHYDFVVMSVAAVVPLILYIVYRWTARERRGGAPALAVGIGAYVAYVVSQYIVLLLSRVREYYADEHAAFSSQSANSISSALIKIAYGLARIPQEELDEKGKKKQQKWQPSRLMGSLGICSFSSATPMALYSTSVAGGFSMDLMMRAMQWDLWNPWARFFEFQSTHPLIAKRVLAASRIAELKKEHPLITSGSFQKQNYWSEFWGDVIYILAPYVGLVVTIIGVVGLLTNGGAERILMGGAPGEANQLWFRVGVGLTLMGLGWLLRLGHSYGNAFRRARIADLVGEVAVSHIRSIPVEIEGQVIGRGVPGLFWSKDLVMQDDSGFVTLIYRQPLGFLEFLFGWLSAEKFVGAKGTFRGWYRRGPAPYVELSDATLGYGQNIRCYYAIFLRVMAILTTLIGLYLLVSKGF